MLKEHDVLDYFLHDVPVKILNAINVQRIGNSVLQGIVEQKIQCHKVRMQRQHNGCFQIPRMDAKARFIRCQQAIGVAHGGPVGGYG